MQKQSIKAALLTFTLTISCVVHAQNISEIAQSDPLVITGAVGTQNTYRYSSMGDGYRSPMSNVIYANLNVSIYGISMPFSLFYSNDNLDFNYPHLTFNISPTYKNWTGHLGQSSMGFSNYVMNMSFNGIGLEYNDKQWRGGIFYGRLRSAINDDPTNPYARTPQYKRMGWGFKVGYGSNRNHVDLYMLRAYDILGSLHEQWRGIIAPQENLVVGLQGYVTPTNWLSLTANVATSVFNTDKNAEKVHTTTSFDKIFDTRYSSLMRFAGDVNANLSLPGISTTISYRMIQPDYTSLGTYYMTNNYHILWAGRQSFQQTDVHHLRLCVCSQRFHALRQPLQPRTFLQRLLADSAEGYMPRERHHQGASPHVKCKFYPFLHVRNSHAGTQHQLVGQLHRK